jgi:hypothetical protein
MIMMIKPGFAQFPGYDEKKTCASAAAIRKTGLDESLALN